MSLTAIIVAAGTSQRMGFDKLLAPIAGKPVLERSIEAFTLCTEVTDIIVVCPKSRRAQIQPQSPNKPINWIDGGADRHDSVAAGLSLLEGSQQSADHYVAVHDGARPLITPDQISQVYQNAQKHHCASSAAPVTDTIKRADDQGYVQDSINREHLWMMQTPQTFRADLLIEAYRTVKAQGERVTDEVSALQLIGHPTFLVNNPEPNIKVTFPQDIIIAEKIIAQRTHR